MKESTDPAERQVLNFRQEALKTLISTIYGLFNHPTYRWYCIEASEAITAWGREFLKESMEKAKKFGFEPVYADTDGFYALVGLQPGNYTVSATQADHDTVTVSDVTVISGNNTVQDFILTPQPSDI